MTNSLAYPQHQVSGRCGRERANAPERRTCPIADQFRRFDYLTSRVCVVHVKSAAGVVDIVNNSISF